MPFPLDRCSICDGKCRPVPGDGPKPAKVMLIGERPGREENAKGRPFIGQSGQELNDTYLRLAGLHRDDVYVTNAVKCFADGNRKPTPKEVDGCSQYLIWREVDEVEPEVVVLLGSTACSLMVDEFGEYIDLDKQHGLPKKRFFRRGIWGGLTIPMYHPAAGLHDTGKMIPLLEDFERLGEILKGKFKQRKDYIAPVYGLIEKPIGLLSYLDTKAREVAIDTERHGSTPFSWQISHRAGTGRMIQCARDGAKECAELFNIWMEDQKVVVDLHNAPQDLDWLDRMGVHPNPNRLRDTMQEAYHLGNQPQGLKALAYRLLGAEMKTFEDVVVPHSREAVAAWLVQAAEYACQNLEYVEQKQLKTKVKTVVKPSLLARRFQAIFNHTTVSNGVTEVSYDPWKALDELFDKPGLTPPEKQFVECIRSQSIHAKVVAKLTGMPGPIPIVGIGNVPLSEVVRYGCADADMTLQVAQELAKIRREVMEGVWDVPEEDWDR